MRFSSAIVLCLALAGCSGAQAEPAPAASPTEGAQPVTLHPALGASYGPTTNAKTLARLAEATKSVPAGAVAARVAIGDVLYPRTQAENEALGGFALLLITAVAQDAEELPLKRVWLWTQKGEVELPSLATAFSGVDRDDVRRVFGPSRTDVLCLMPLFATRIESIVYVDFAKNRDKLEVFRSPPPPDEDAMPKGLSIIDVGEPDMDLVEKLAEDQFEWSARGKAR